MAHPELPFLTTITLGFTVAFVLGMVASKLRLPPIVGYLIAGVVVGPYTPGVMADVKIAEELSEIGILLLMFGVGLHFSIRDLLEVRRIAIPGAIVQITAATLLGAAVAYFWDWPLTSGLMLGFALSVASTVVLLRALEQHNLLQSTNGNVVIGWLIVEDVAMVLALVLIPALAKEGGAASGQEIAMDLLIAIGKVIVFVVFMVVAGSRLLPKLLMIVARTHSRELFTLAVFAVAMGVALGAAKLFGVSFALGAFFAGMMIRESDLSHEVADKALPLQDAFAVLFFVAVGMLFNPHILVERPLQVLAVVAIIMVGKSIAAIAIVLLFRYPFKTALLVSAGLAQIGEFSFILANIGVSSGLLPETGRDLILAGAMISISLNPACFHVSQHIQEWLGFTPARKPKDEPLPEDVRDDLAHLKPEEYTSLRQCVILVGHGRVGKHISENMSSAHMDVVIVDSNRQRIEQLRANGAYAIAGDATQEETLRHAGIDKAVAVIVAVPNPYEARRVTEAARHVKPEVKLLVRAHNDEEVEYFTKQGVDLAIMGPREVARRMVQYLQNDLS